MNIKRFWTIGLLPLIGACQEKSVPTESSTQVVEANFSSREKAGPISYGIPKGWESVPTSSSMRLGQFKLAKQGGDTEDAEIVLFFFGEGQGGPVQENLDRWMRQMQQPDGKSSLDAAKKASWAQEKLRVSTLDVTGTYVAETTPGSGVRLNKPGYRLLAAVVESPRGNVFFKAVGPEKTLAHWATSIDQALRSAR